MRYLRESLEEGHFGLLAWTGTSSATLRYLVNGPGCDILVI